MVGKMLRYLPIGIDLHQSAGLVRKATAIDLNQGRRKLAHLKVQMLQAFIECRRGENAGANDEQNRTIPEATQGARKPLHAAGIVAIQLWGLRAERTVRSPAS
jgi:hypothetical protein